MHSAERPTRDHEDQRTQLRTATQEIAWTACDRFAKAERADQDGTSLHTVMKQTMCWLLRVFVAGDGIRSTDRRGTTRISARGRGQGPGRPRGRTCDWPVEADQTDQGGPLTVHRSARMLPFGIFFLILFRIAVKGTLGAAAMARVASAQSADRVSGGFLMASLRSGPVPAGTAGSRESSDPARVPAPQAFGPSWDSDSDERSGLAGTRVRTKDRSQLGLTLSPFFLPKGTKHISARMEPGVEGKGCGELKGDCETRPGGSGVPWRVSSGAPVLHRPSDGSAEGLARGFVGLGTGVLRSCRDARA